MRLRLVEGLFSRVSVVEWSSNDRSVGGSTPDPWFSTCWSWVGGGVSSMPIFEFPVCVPARLYAESGTQTVIIVASNCRVRLNSVYIKIEVERERERGQRRGECWLLRAERFVSAAVITFWSSPFQKINAGAEVALLFTGAHELIIHVKTSYRVLLQLEWVRKEQQF